MNWSFFKGKGLATGKTLLEGATPEQRWTLLREQYLALSQESQAYRALVAQIFGGGAALFAGVAAVLRVTGTTPPMELYWAVPFALLAVIFLAIQQYARITFTVTYMKDLEQEIIKLTQEKLLRFTGPVEESLLDPNTAPWYIDGVIILTGVGIMGVYVVIVKITLNFMHAWPIVRPWHLFSPGTWFAGWNPDTSAVAYLVVQVLAFSLCVAGYMVGTGSAEGQYFYRMLRWGVPVDSLLVTRSREKKLKMVRRFRGKLDSDIYKSAISALQGADP